MGNSINRIIWIDLIKCLAIFLVILGHTITSFNHNYLNSPLYLSIYSFHMPLFMMISGYMISIKHLNNPLKYLKKRVYSILFPALIWGAIVIGIRILLGVHIQHGFMHQWWWGLWFLKSLFACDIIILLSYLFTKKTHLYSHNHYNNKPAHTFNTTFTFSTTPQIATVYGNRHDSK